MSDKEIQAHDLTLRKDYLQAVQLYDQILGPNSNNFKTSKERVVACLMGRAECCQELNRHETVIVDCRRVLKLISEAEVNTIGIRVRRRLVHSLYKLRRYSEADATCREWQSLLPNNIDVCKLLDRYRTVIQMANGQRANQRISQQRLDEEMMNIDEKLEALANSCPKSNDRVKRSSKKSSDGSDERRHALSKKLDFGANTNSFQKQIDHISSLSLNDSGVEKDVDSGEIICSYCCLNFTDRSELRTHCQSEAHQTVIMSDEGRDWKWRPPPRGFTVDSYSLCESHSLGGPCRYGAQCVEAHGSEELAEWRERFEYRRMKLQRASEKELYGKSYTELLLEKWIQAPSPEKIMKERLDGVEETCSSDLVTTVSSKVSKRDWTFVLKTKLLLRAVALLQDAHRNHFTLKQVFPGEPKPNKKGQHGHKIVEATLTSDQEWCITNLDSKYTDPVTDQSPTLEHRVKVVFSTDIYGTFRQSVVFDFGTEPVLVKHLCVDVVPVTDADKIKEIKKEIILSSEARWDAENAEIVQFSSTLIPIVSSIDNERDRDLFNTYPCPRSNTFTLTQCTVMEKRLTRNNYRSRMHELLYVEEMARYEQVARYNLTTKLRITTSYLLAPSGMATSTAKYSVSGELFALMSLGKDVSEDTSAGRLILNNCTTVFLTSEQPKMHVDSNGKAIRKVYEALIEDKGKNMVYMRLSAQTVQELNIKADTDFMAEVQFQLNRLTYCEWHHAIDKIADFRVIFPDTYLEPNIPWTPQRQWSDTLDPRLNLKQKEAVVAITTPMHINLPPILIIGPFGTGKTYTLAQAIKQLLMQTDTRILICTHSNSAADLYIKDYLHPWVESGMEEARPLRIYYHKRWVATANQIVQKYCMIENNGNVRNFLKPTLQDIMKHRVIVVTLSISMELANLGLPKGYFTHILLDEAAQAMECEAIMPLALAGEQTRIVLAGDHMQLSPELFSAFAKERNLHVSLLERLYDHYPSTFPCKILLCENYRAHEAIIHFTSELFYDQKLISSGKQPRHDKFYPLTFFTTRGEDVQDTNSTAFYNNSEVYEVVERVSELRKKWPAAWGKLDEHSIGIMTPYADQVFRIRSELRKRRMGGISVERVLNVQGKQFRAIFLSTVRTRRTCAGTKPDELDYGFLSNSKLLNTAITRAQSLVAVVGDPVALCSIGRCRKVWERFIEICNQNKSLFGITWSLLRSQLDGVELKKTYVLNPLAPEFIPRAFQSEAYIKSQQNSIGTYNTQTNIVPASTSTQSANIRFPVNTTNSNQIPPFMGTPGPPVYQPPYSVYYYQNQGPAAQNPNVFPTIRQPPVNATQPNNVQTTWNNAFSMLSPKNKNVPDGPIRMPPVLPTMRSPNNVTMSSLQHMNKQSMFPMPQRTSPSPPHFITDNYDNLARVNQLYNHHINQISHPVMPVPSHNKIPVEKEHIQFLQNVHFPERATIQESTRAPEWNLLPPNVTFQDMTLEPKARQLEWYRHLLDTQGVESATKFSEILQHIITMNKQQQQQSTAQELYLPSNDMSRLDDILNDKPNFNQNLYHNIPNGHANIQQLPERNWMMNDNKQEMNYLNKPVILRDVENSMLILQQQQSLREERLLQQQISANRTFIPDTSDIPWKFHDSTTHSVPLYRRQAGQGQGGQQNQMQEMYGEQHNLLDDKMSVSSNSFSFGHGMSNTPDNMHLINMQHRQVLNNLTPQQVSQLQQERLQQQINADFAQTLNMNNMGRKQESVEEMITRQHAQNSATYASVLRNPVKPIDEPERNGDPFAVLRDLGQKNSQHNSSGLYHYFQ